MGEVSMSLILLSTPSPLQNRGSSLLVRVGRQGSLVSLSIAVSPWSLRLHAARSQSARFGSSLRYLEDRLVGKASVWDQSGESPGKWPEWENLLEYLTAGGYMARQAPTKYPPKVDDELFAVFEEIPEEFADASKACLLFARERPDLLRSLGRKNIEVLVENVSPFLFKNAENSVRRMKAFIKGNELSALGAEMAFTVDLMKYLLSCVYDSHHRAGRDRERNSREVAESSARSLLLELTKIDRAKGVSVSPGEAQSKRQLTGREWECPQCEFFNNGRNSSCLRCDLWRPDNEVPRNREASESEISQRLDRILGRLSSPAAEPGATLADVSVSGNSLPEGEADGFPEIMPMRKGENRFVVSKKKDRSLTSPQYKRRAAIDQAESSSFVPFVPFPPGYFARNDDAAAAADHDVDHDPDRDHEDDDDDDDDDDGDDDKEADQVDMSEDAKAQRWFKRVAEINDISELSKIPDEDFPEIMPMRKGVNRFVVSRRKTPLERRLTSQQKKSTPRYPFSDEE